MATATMNVFVASPEEVLFTGPAHSVLLPGEQGVFEVLPLHRPLLSRLFAGMLVIDGRPWPIRRVVARVADDEVTVVVELH